MTDNFENDKKDVEYKNIVKKRALDYYDANKRISKKKKKKKNIVT